MFADWETFYLMIGTSAGALVGVMFVVITLTTEVATEQINRGTTIYQTPTVFHLSAIVATSAVTLLPEHLLPISAGALVIVAALGLIYSGITTYRTLQRYDFYQATLADRIFFGLIPCLLYLVLGLGALAVFGVPEVAAEAVAGASMLLLLVSVRNAWDLATFSVRMARTEAAKHRATK